MQILNSLGAPIKSIWVADADMNVYEAHNVAAGQKGGLIPSSQKSSEKSGPKGLLREISFAAPAEHSVNCVGKNILPNTYIAVLEGNPFLENALGSSASAKRTKSSAVVFGIFGAEDNVAGGAK